MRLESQFVAPWLHLTRNVDTPYNVLPPQFEKLVYNKPTATSSIYPTVIGIMFTINLSIWNFIQISSKSHMKPPFFIIFLGQSTMFIQKSPSSHRFFNVFIQKSPSSHRFFNLFIQKSPFSHRVFSGFPPFAAPHLQLCSAMEPRTKMAAPWAPSTSWALAAHWAKSSST